MTNIDKWQINGKSSSICRDLYIYITKTHQWHFPDILKYSKHLVLNIVRITVPVGNRADTGKFLGVNPAAVDSIGIASLLSQSKLCYTSSILSRVFSWQDKTTSLGQLFRVLRLDSLLNIHTPTTRVLAVCLNCGIILPHWGALKKNCPT